MIKKININTCTFLLVSVFLTFNGIRIDIHHKFEDKITLESNSNIKLEPKYGTIHQVNLKSY